MGKCIIAQWKAPISSESVEGNKNVEKCAVHKILRMSLSEYAKEPAVGRFFVYASYFE